jgi:hypothetical protein
VTRPAIVVLIVLEILTIMAMLFTVVTVASIFRLGSRIVSRWRDLLWTFRHRGDPVTVFFYDHPILPGMTRNPFPAHVYSRIGTDLIFEVPPLRLYIHKVRLSVALDEYGTAWCWGHEGEEVDALKVARALA